ncbi:UNKNOWN [Stylonychia lemnae]|uniref:Uncharacterized protein n=1 Tax=Stylonychia lemnae TaxID=5949 RepID=A0A077ZYZ6_STYLE|nr:UNKNOWN [Stylonychia lemnae]|eukprot:CDW75140.1 UNKNOWN [Stylonychia lemnae]
MVSNGHNDNYLQQLMKSYAVSDENQRYDILINYPLLVEEPIVNQQYGIPQRFRVEFMSQSQTSQQSYQVSQGQIQVQQQNDPEIQENVSMSCIIDNEEVITFRDTNGTTNDNNNPSDQSKKTDLAQDSESVFTFRHGDSFPTNLGINQ